MTYEDFIEAKLRHAEPVGFEPREMCAKLFPFQRHVVGNAIRSGRYAIFAGCGLGKTPMQLEWARQVSEHTGEPVLILAPLAVSAQTIDEGRKFGVKVRRVGDGGEIQITNYEQLHKLDVSGYSGIVLDESSILKNFTGKTKRLIMDMFARTPYKLACTATPAPNDPNELGNHSQFLDVMDSTDVRMRWFVRDEEANDNYRLKAHAIKDFYGWVATWAAMFERPSDIGFSDDGYRLPGLDIVEKCVDVKARDDGELFAVGNVNATTYNAEVRRTMPERIAESARIANLSDGQVIVWIRHNDEGSAVRKLLPDAVEVSGSELTETKETKLRAFAKGKYRILITKPKIAQYGLNFQNCHTQIFSSLDFSFESFYQAVRRSYRFGQKKRVGIHVITVPSMANVADTLKAKEADFMKMREEMAKAVNGGREYRLVKDYDFEEKKTDQYWVMLGDSTVEIDRIGNDSIDLSIFSPPFSSLYTYSDNIRDMGNCSDHAEFFEQYDFLLAKLFAKMRPGRIVAVHTKDLAVYKNSSGYTGLYDFTGDNHRALEKAGFKYHSKVTIWTNPVLEMQRTKTQRLLYKQLRADSSLSGVGLPEYVTLFRKWDGDDNLQVPIRNKTKDNFPLDTWQEWASPVWMDIDRVDVLNNYRAATDQGDEKHIAPLQLSVIERCIKMWSNPGERVFTPFLGVGSEVHQAVSFGRFGIGIELKESYYRQAIRNIESAIKESSQMEFAL